jgi:hypothetical protein
MGNEAGMSFGISTIGLAVPSLFPILAGRRELRRKKDVKNEVRSHYVVENKQKCLWNEAIFWVQSHSRSGAQRRYVIGNK